MSRQKIKEQYKKNTTTYQFMLRHNENRRQNLCRDRIFSCNDTDYCNLEKPVETERIRRRKIFLATRQSMSRHCMKKLCRDQVMNVATPKDKVSSPDRETKSQQMMLT